MNITTCSVRVMRSFDYSHFEITLGGEFNVGENEITATDNLRKQAARLADKAVEQYKVAKANAEKEECELRDFDYKFRAAEHIRAIEDSDRTVEQKAQLKAFDDAKFEASRRYDYEDDWHDAGYDDEEGDA